MNLFYYVKFRSSNIETILILRKPSQVLKGRTVETEDRRPATATMKGQKIGSTPYAAHMRDNSSFTASTTACKLAVS